MMPKHKINISFMKPTLRRLQIASIIRNCIRAVLAAENVTAACEINVLVTTDEGIRQINDSSRGIDRATDVLSFPMFQMEAGMPPEDWTAYQDPETGMCPLGDMAISLERATAQAENFGHSLRREVGYLTIHSVLHLLGYDHMDEGPQKKLMRTREEAIAATISRMQRG